MALERDIENIVEQSLIRNGWVVNIDEPNKNVFHQKAKTKEDNKKLKSLRPDFCLYLDNNSISPELILETKKPNMN
ncbi:MAG: restriction endonuclease subunit R, partial [Solirubrobacteraceae bacterium]